MYYQVGDHSQPENFNYDKHFFEFEHTYKGRNDLSIDSSNAKTANKLISEKSPYKDLKGESHIRYLITNKEQADNSEQSNNINASNSNNSGNSNDKNFDVYARARPDFLPWLISFGNQFRSIVCTLIVPGDSERMPGDLIYFDLHEFGATDDIKDKLNEYISGTYFVTAVRHKVTRDAAMKYVTIIQCVKNSYEKEISNDGQGSSGE